MAELLSGRRAYIRGAAENTWVLSWGLGRTGWISEGDGEVTVPPLQPLVRWEGQFTGEHARLCCHASNEKYGFDCSNIQQKERRKMKKQKYKSSGIQRLFLNKVCFDFEKPICSFWVVLVLKFEFDLLYVYWNHCTKPPTASNYHCTTKAFRLCIVYLIFIS